MSKSAAVTFVVGAPDSGQSSFTTIPTSTVANNSNVITLTALLRDATGNPVPNAAVTFSTTGTNNTLSATATFTDATGQVSATLASAKAENKTVGFNNVFVSKTGGVSFYAGPPSLGTSSFVAAPTAVVDDGVASSTLTLTLRDANSNPVGSQAVTFSTSAINPNLLPASGTTDSSGIFATVFRSTKAQATSVTATFGGPFLTAAVTFLVGNPSSPNISTTFSPTSLVADGVSTSVLSLTLRDSTNNPVPNAPLTFSSSNPCDVLSHPTTLSDTNGNANCSIASTIAEVKTFSVNNAFFSRFASITFVPGPPATSHTTLTATPSSVTANGSSQSVLNLSVADAFNNTVKSANVTFSSSGSGGIIANRFMAVDGNGKAQTNIHSAFFGARTVTAKVAPIQVTAAVTFATPSSCTGGTVLYPEVPVVLVDGGTGAVENGDFNEDARLDLAFAGGNVGIALARGNGLFNPIKRFSGTAYSDLAKTDLNGDGHLDLVLLASTGTSIATYTGAGDGNFTAGLLYPDNANNLGIAIGDMNGDGKGDVVYVNYANNQVRVRLVNSTGALGAASFANTSAGPYDLALGDLNGDGRLDAVVASSTSPNIDVLLGAGRGALGTKTSYPGTGPYVAVALADFNLDGKLDVVATANGNTWFDTFRGNGSGGLGAPATSPSAQVLTPLTPFAVVAVDMNVDGSPDVVTSTLNGTVDVALGYGNGSFQPAVSANAGVDEIAMTVADIDADGNLDVAAVDNTAPRAAVLLGAGTGYFVTNPSPSPGFGSTGGTLADVNGDGNQDILMTAFFGSVVAVALGQGDGTFGAFTFPSTVNGPRGVNATDLNNDGKLDVFAAEGNTVITFLGQGDGTFQTGVPGAQACPSDLAISANFNGDAFRDVAFSCPLNSQAVVMLGNGDGTFLAPSFTSTGQAGSLDGRVGAGDITGDGKVDLLSVETSDTTLKVFRGAGNGTFGAAVQTLSLPYTTQQVAVADLNVDGRLDAVVAAGNGFVYPFLNVSGTLNAAPSFLCPMTFPTDLQTSDVDGDGWLDILVSGNGAFCIIHSAGSGAFGTVTLYPSTQDTTAISAADLNHDGLMDLVTQASHSIGQPGDFYVVHLAKGCTN